MRNDNRKCIVYFRHVDGAPTTRLAFHVNPSHSARFPYALTVLVPVPNIAPNALNGQAFKNCVRLEDLIDSALSSQTCVFMGHVYAPSTMRLIFYAHEPGPTAIRVKTNLFKSESFAVESRHDPNWSLYDAELRPSATEFEYGEFSQLYRKLEEMGDNHFKERPVDFAAHFPSESQLIAFVAEVNALGYKMENAEPWNAPGRWWCEVTRTSAIDVDTFLPKLAEFRSLVEKHDGEFDGWACTVMSDKYL